MKMQLKQYLMKKKYGGHDLGVLNSGYGPA